MKKSRRSQKISHSVPETALTAPTYTHCTQEHAKEKMFLHFGGLPLKGMHSKEVTFRDYKMYVQESFHKTDMKVMKFDWSLWWISDSSIILAHSGITQAACRLTKVGAQSLRIHSVKAAMSLWQISSIKEPLSVWERYHSTVFDTVFLKFQVGAHPNWFNALSMAKLKNDVSCGCSKPSGSQSPSPQSSWNSDTRSPTLLCPSAAGPKFQALDAEGLCDSKSCEAIER